MNRAEQRRQARDDERLIARGLPADGGDPAPAAALIRRLHALAEGGKRTGDISPFVVAVNEKITATTRSLKNVPIACGKGCPHCCYIWVSAYAAEILHVAKFVRKLGPSAVSKVNRAYEATKDYSHQVRHKHPYPCPMLSDYGSCTIYTERPRACRLAVSTDAETCARADHNVTDENIPVPLPYLASRSQYSIVEGVALRAANLPHQAYEFNEGLARALSRDDAEAAWLRGEDIFADVKRDPVEVLDHPRARALAKHVFGTGFCAFPRPAAR